MPMAEWFSKLANAEKIAVIAVIAIIGGLFKQCKSLFKKEKAHVDTNNILDRHEIALKQLGQLEEKDSNSQERIRKLEVLLAQPQIVTNPTVQNLPQPTQEAKDLASHIENDEGSYPQALKAIAEGENEKADLLLDESQEYLDTIQKK